MPRDNLAINSKWTASHPPLDGAKGWRHFWVSGRLYQGEVLFIELRAACDRKVTLLISADALIAEERFIPGWSLL